MVKEKTDPIETRLNAIIALLSELLISKEKIPVTSIYQCLDRSGLNPKEIGNIFGIAGGNISSAMSKVKKKKPKSSSGEKND